MEKLNLFLQYMHTVMHERMGYLLNMFNAASGGTILIRMTRAPKMAGGIEQSDFFGITPNLFRRRNPAGDEKLELKDIVNKMKNSIRLAFTSELWNLSKNTWHWIGRNPELAGAQFGKDAADQKIEEYLVRMFGVLRATVGSNEKTVLDVTKRTDENKFVNLVTLANTASQFGDAQSKIRAWIMPTNARTELLVNALENKTRLFTVGTVNIHQDAEGRRIITSDDPNLQTFNEDGTIDHWVYGLTPAAVIIQELDDYDELYDEQGGGENIKRTYQVNWSVNFSINGYKYDETQLTDSHDDKGKFASASDAAINAAENWSPVYTSHKETAGVALRARAGTLLKETS